jgi:hypothetical protein
MACQCRKRPFGGQDYRQWLHTKFDEFTSTVKQIATSVEKELPAAWGKPGQPGDPVQILAVTEKLAERCVALLNWELEIAAAEPPLDLRRIGNALRGIAAGILNELQRLPDELNRAVEGARLGTHEFSVRLNFASPPQIGAFLKEMEAVEANRERLS